MARVSFTLRKSDGGSALQVDPIDDIEVDNDSALRGDNFSGVIAPPTLPPSPSVPQFGSSSTFTATPTDYRTVLLQWDIGGGLSASATDENAVPIEIAVRYSSVGEPMSPLEGSLVTTIRSDNEAYSFTQGGVPEGSWAYYSLFVKYESTTLRPWYERVASLVVLVPKNYGSTDLLWSRIPEHYRVNDTETSTGVPEDLADRGVLYRLLSVFGWEMDRARTLTNYLMRQKDPDLATPEVLDALSYELGIDVQSQDLGSTRLRNIIGDIRYLREYKGTTAGVQQWLTAISGCPVFVRPLAGNTLTTAQSKFTGTVTTTTASADVPSGNEWVVEGSGVTATKSAAGLTITQTSASGIVVARTRVTSAEQAQRYWTYLDLTGRSGAQMLGMSLTSAVLPRTAVTVDEIGLVEKPYPKGFVLSPSYDTDDWFQAPINLGVPGDGTLTTAPMYLSVVLLFDGPDTSITLQNVVLNKDERYPYSIDIYSQRVNLFRDPQIALGTNASTSYWHTTTSASPTVVYTTNGALGASLGGTEITNASVTFSTQNGAGTGASNNIPVLLGIPYYVSIDDPYDKVTEVSLISRTYGVLATSDEAVFERSLGSPSAYRKYWMLSREYNAPWLPRSIADCYIKFTAVGNSDDSLEITRPLLEAFTYGGEYFDGDTIDGGWLQTSTIAGSIRDYRWGDAGTNRSFSYYTSDFQRTRNTIDRLLPSLIPVTQSVTLTDENYNRVFGYTGTGLP
jgi:hypothetical protein